MSLFEDHPDPVKRALAKMGHIYEIYFFSNAHPIVPVQDKCYQMLMKCMLTYEALFKKILIHYPSI